MRSTPLILTMSLAIVLSLGGCRAAGGAPSANANSTAPGAQPTQTTPSFPSDWFGTWTGTARLLSVGSEPFEFGMTLVIGPTKDPSRFTWTLIYTNNGETEERPYELVAIDAAAGTYEIDEKNGIKLPTIYLGGSLRSAFVVDGVIVISTDRLERTPDGDRLISELVSIREGPSTGGENGKPKVTVASRLSLQRTELKRTMPR